jgi:hypothetical protein
MLDMVMFDTEFRMYGRALLNQEVLDGELKGHWPALPVLYWPFNERGTSMAYDKGAYANHMPWTNQRVWSFPHSDNGQIRSGGGSAQYVAAVANKQISLHKADFTFCLWHRLTSANTDQSIVEVGKGTGSRENLFYGYVSDSVSLVLMGQTAAVIAESAAAEQIWFHRCVVLRGTQNGVVAMAATAIELYTWGSLSSSQTGTGDYVGGNNNNEGQQLLTNSSRTSFDA